MFTGLVRAQEELKYQKLLTYWQIGRIIARDILGDGQSSPHGSAFYQRLAPRDVSRRILDSYNIIQFCQSGYRIIGQIDGSAPGHIVKNLGDVYRLGNGPEMFVESALGRTVIIGSD